MSHQQHTPDEAAINALREAVLLGSIKPTADQQTILRLSVQRDELLAALERMLKLNSLGAYEQSAAISAARAAIANAKGSAQ